jgi:hypothetical protein
MRGSYHLQLGLADLLALNLNVRSLPAERRDGLLEHDGGGRQTGTVPLHPHPHPHTKRVSTGASRRGCPQETSVLAADRGLSAGGTEVQRYRAAASLDVDTPRSPRRSRRSALRVGELRLQQEGSWSGVNTPVAPLRSIRQKPEFSCGCGAFNFSAKLVVWGGVVHCTRTLAPEESSSAASPHALPTHSVWMGGLTYFMVSKMANASESYASFFPSCATTNHTPIGEYPGGR